VPTNSLALLPNAMACRYSRGRGISIHRPPDDEYQLNIYTSHRVYLPKFFMMFAYTMLVRLGLGVPWYLRMFQPTCHETFSKWVLKPSRAGRPMQPMKSEASRRLSPAGWILKVLESNAEPGRRLHTSPFARASCASSFPRNSPSGSIFGVTTLNGMARCAISPGRLAWSAW